MSIAGIVTVYLEENGGGRLALNPAKKGEGTGQATLRFDTAPEEVTALNGRLVWGGDSMIMLGDTLIGRRHGYTKIVFVDAESFRKAVAKAATAVAQE